MSPDRQHPGDDTEPTAERLARAALGDAAAFADLVGQYEPTVYGLVLSIVRNAEDAHDIVQDVWVKVARHLPELRERSRFGAWLYRIARNCCMDYHAARTSHPRPALLRPDEDDDRSFDVIDAHAEAPEDRVMAEDERRKVWETLGALSEADRTILFLRESQELPYAEIARALGITANAAEVRVFRARERFRRQFRLIEDAPPACNVSPLQLSALAATELGAATSIMLRRHAETCVSCGPRLQAISLGRRLYAGESATPAVPAIQAAAPADAGHARAR